MPPCRYNRAGVCGHKDGFKGHQCYGQDCVYRHELPGLADLRAILVYLLEA